MRSRFDGKWRVAAALIATSAAILITASAYTSRTASSLDELRSGVSSLNSARFQAALDQLLARDEPAALNVWRIALRNKRSDLRARAWRRYREIQVDLNRKTSVPQVTRIFAPPSEILKTASRNGLDVTIWSSSSSETIAAIPPYLVEALRRTQIQCDVLYDTIADWQIARSRGEGLAASITPEYQKADYGSANQLRIAVIDLNHKTSPAPGFSDWLGDPENILMRGGSRIAYLDSFRSDGTRADITAHVTTRFTRRGYPPIGYYTLDEFSVEVERWFPGRTFNPGKRRSADDAGAFQPLLAEGNFHSYDEAQAEFKSLANEHPDLASFVKLGTSYEGRDIFALKISRNVQGDDPIKPDVLITGCHHAREWISVEPPIYFASKLVNGYATDDSIKFLVDNLQFWIVPIVNPDGLTYSQGSPNDRMDLARTWRKNRRPISIGGCVTSVGVDLNRNYDFQWRLENDTPCSDYCSSSLDCIHDDVGASDDPRDDVYRGPSAESEPEIRAIKALVDDPARRFRAQIDYHNYAQLILYPWSFEADSSPDSSVVAEIANRMSDALREVDNKIYTPEQAINLYPTTGSSTDYAYGVNGVPAPFVVEMRPFCCNFDVPESEIDPTNRENWAGALPLLDWTSGPPILTAVNAYSRSPIGTFNLVYSARWVASAGAGQSGRQLIVDTRLDRIQPGPLLVQLQFSKPMNPQLAPRATMGRPGHRDEVTLSANGPNEGWHRTLYPNDTWIGEAVIFQDFNDTDPWVLAVFAQDTFDMNTDARPATIADYPAGTGQWSQFEDENGQGSNGGVDLSHILAPTLRDDFPGIFIAFPAGGERFAGGESIDLAWRVSKGASFDPVSQKLYFSTDSGKSFASIADSVAGFADRFTFSLPRTTTVGARFRVQAIDRATGNSIFGESRGDFTIGANVGSGVLIDVLSSEKADLNWSDNSTDGNAIAGASRLTINLAVTNRGTVPIVNPFIVASRLTKQNVLLSRDPGSSPAAGARQSIDAGSDNVLSPGESAQVRVVVGLVANKKFKAFVELFGVPSGGSIDPGGSVRVWNGKPRNT